MKEFGNEFVTEDESDIRKPKSPTGLVDDISVTESPLSSDSETSVGDWVSSPKELLCRGRSWLEVEADPKLQADRIWNDMLLMGENSDHEIDSPVKEEDFGYMGEIECDYDALIEDMVWKRESPEEELPELMTEDPTPGQSKKLVDPVRGSRKSPNLQLKKRRDHKKQSKKLTDPVSASPKSPNLQLKKTGLRRSARLEKKEKK